jgi:hypothetical protein
MHHPPLARATLIEIRDRHPHEADVRTLLREIRRQHEVLLEVEALRKTIDSAWLEARGGQLVALYRLKILLMDEKTRFSTEMPVPIL